MNIKTFDLVVIGGGAAGFFGAISAAEHATCPLNILILEKTGQLLNKVKISGGGRCNVTHDCLEPKELVKFYPRGHRSLIGPFTHFGPKDTIRWFEEKGVSLKVEPDGRMFPTTDNSQTIINCLTETAEELGIEIQTKASVSSVIKKEDEFLITVKDQGEIQTKALLIATGGTRLAAGAELAKGLGHNLLPPVPSLFTFTIDDPLIEDLEGLSVTPAEVSIIDTKYTTKGPLLITHWGVSGPGILKLSALASRELSELDYQFTIKINWCPDAEVARLLKLKRQEWGKKQISTRSPLAAIPKRLWSRFCRDLDPELTWSQLTKAQEEVLLNTITNTTLSVSGKSINKDEFVTCGGVELKELQLKRMESKIHPGLYYAGEVINVDGVTGGFNFQNAWTTGYLAGKAIAESHSD